MKSLRFLSVITFIIFAFSVLIVAQPAQADEICGLFDTLSVVEGEYTIQNNVWGATTAQCVDVPDTNATGFTVSQSEHNQGSVASYPSIFKGCHWGDCTVNSGMPLQVNQVNNAPFSWSVNANAPGTWNVAAEAWFSPITDSTDGYDGGAELMIWLDYQGMQPAGSQVATVSIGGATWEVWFAQLAWNYVAYRRIGAVSSASLDLDAFIDDAVSRGYIQTSWYLHAFEAGFEIISNGEGLTSNSFSFAVNSSGPTPTQPGPTNTPAATNTSPPNTPPPSSFCSVDYNIVNQWGSGFQADVTITNNSGSSIAGWELTWTFAAGQQFSSGWNATFNPSGSSMSVSNVASHWNGTIPANGGTRSFGFIGSSSGSITIPTDFAVNGVSCGEGGVPTNTPVPPTNTPVQPTNTPVQPTNTPVQPTNTPVQPTNTPVQPTNTPVPPTNTPVPPTATPGGGGTCAVDYDIVNQWNTGFQGNIVITNNGSTAINGYTLQWTFEGNEMFASGWNATYSSSGQTVTASNPAGHWNGTIQPNGGTVTFGFQGTHNGTVVVPSTFTLNGQVCGGQG
jgi:hypothetical protein